MTVKTQNVEYFTEPVINEQYTKVSIPLVYIDLPPLYNKVKSKTKRVILEQGMRAIKGHVGDQNLNKLHEDVYCDLLRFLRLGNFFDRKMHTKKDFEERYPFKDLIYFARYVEDAPSGFEETPSGITETAGAILFLYLDPKIDDEIRQIIGGVLIQLIEVLKLNKDALPTPRLSLSAINRIQGSETIGRTNNQPTLWTVDEIDAAINAYFELQENLKRDPKTNKSEVFRKLHSLYPDRTESAFERRFQNISHILNEMGFPCIEGSKRYSHDAELLRQRMSVKMSHSLSSADADELPRLIRAAQSLINRDEAPVGNPNPLKISGNKQERYVRDAQIIAWVKRNANGQCELCRHPAPFVDASDEPFLEVHHVTFMCEKGGDTSKNAIAVCPNCHRCLHFGKNKQSLKQQLYQSIARLEE